MSPVKRPTWSQSKLGMFTRCGMQYKFRYIDGLRIPPGVALIVGTATHKAVEYDLTNKIQSGELLPLEAVQDLAALAFKANWNASEVKVDEDELAEAGSMAKVKGAASDKAVRLASLHHRKVAPSISPVHIERYFRLELKGYPFDLDGFMDVQEPDAVRDTKTTGKSPSKDEADNSMQLTMYGLAFRSLEGRNPAKLILDYLVDKKEPQEVTQTSERSDEDYRRLVMRAERAHEAIDKGVFIPTDPSNWVCSAKWCGYWESVCPFGRRARVQVGFENP